MTAQPRSGSPLCDPVHYPTYTCGHQVRTCTECGATEPLDAYVRINTRRPAYYGRCRACRNRGLVGWRRRPPPGRCPSLSVKRAACQ